MKINKKLTTLEKIKIFKNIPMATVGAYTLIIGSSMMLLLAVKNPSELFGFEGLIALAIFLITIYFLLNHASEAFPRMINAIENGVCIEGQLLESKGTGAKINGQPLVKMKLSYELYGQQYTCEERVIAPSKNILKYLLLVDANNPENAVYVETLPDDLRMEVIRRNKIA